MAQIKNITLKIESASTADKRKVTVGFKLAFSATDAGKTYQYRISLRGDDTDEQPTPIGFYYFRFGGNETFSPVLTAVQGEKSFSQARDISTQILNEDPGFKWVQVDINTKIKVPNLDELIAEVSLYRSTNNGLLGLVDKKLSPIKTVLL